MVGQELRLEEVRKVYGAPGAEVVAIDNISLHVRPGEFMTVVGPSGCGKSTFLKICAGLMKVTSGRVLVDGASVEGPPPGLIYLFQQYSNSLLPWRTVSQNVAFAIEHLNGMSATQRRAYCLHYLDMVGLADFADRFPRELSGGMQQRVAIARALAAKPGVLLLDEPFSAVDALTRIELHKLMLKLWEEQRFTALLVTHDVDEAVFLSDRIAVLSKRPSRISELLSTGLERPRDKLTTPELPRFLELRHHLLAQLTGGAHG